MKSKQLIGPGNYGIPPVQQTEGGLRISELYYDTIQGEGPYTGAPAVFLRLKGCTLSCKWCDSKEIWRQGRFFTYLEIFDIIKNDTLKVVERLSNGHVLVITGGSPLIQQERIVGFIAAFTKQYGFRPVIHMENECVIRPINTILCLVDVWMNSPKLANSGEDLIRRFKPELLSLLSNQNNSWFKFVVRNKKDWQEIEDNYLHTGLIRKDQVVLMPEGATRKAIQRNREKIIELAIKNGVRYSSRYHVLVWDKKTGV